MNNNPQRNAISRNVSVSHQASHIRRHALLSLICTPWWRHQMETFSASLAICAGNSPVPGEYPSQRPVTRSFDVFFDLRLNKRLSKQSWDWWFETLLRPLWRRCNAKINIFWSIGFTVDCNGQRQQVCYIENVATCIGFLTGIDADISSCFVILKQPATLQAYRLKVYISIFLFCIDQIRNQLFSLARLYLQFWKTPDAIKCIIYHHMMVDIVLHCWIKKGLLFTVASCCQWISNTEIWNDKFHSAEYMWNFLIRWSQSDYGECLSYRLLCLLLQSFSSVILFVKF